MTNKEKLKELMQKHFDHLSPQEFLENLKEWCPMFHTELLAEIRMQDLLKKLKPK